MGIGLATDLQVLWADKLAHRRFRQQRGVSEHGLEGGIFTQPVKVGIVLRPLDKAGPEPQRLWFKERYPAQIAPDRHAADCTDL